MMKFKKWKEMYDLVEKGTDLYNPITEEYVFVYNDAGALCHYSGISKDEAVGLAKDAKESSESWSGFLGSGGVILDDLYYDGYRYLDCPENKLYLAPSYDYCKETYANKGWMTTKDFEKEEL